MAVTATVSGYEDIKAALGRFPESSFDRARLSFSKAALAAQKDVIDNLAFGSLNTRTGFLKRSIQTSVRGRSLADLNAALFSAAQVGSTDVVYAPVHEFGAIIRAKKAYAKLPGGPYLNIPLPDNKTPAGVMRKTAKQIFEDGGRTIRSKKGNWIVLGRKNPTQALKSFPKRDFPNMPDAQRARMAMMANYYPAFVLKKQVVIKPRLGMRKAAENQVPNILNDLSTGGLFDGFNSTP